MTSPGDKVSDTACKTGYVKVDDACEETCALTPCQESIEIRKRYSFYKRLYAYQRQASLEHRAPAGKAQRV